MTKNIIYDNSNIYYIFCSIFFHFKISLFSDIKMLVPTFVGVYLQIPDEITINMLVVIVCV